jgi:hypothetical protein
MKSEIEVAFLNTLQSIDQSQWKVSRLIKKHVLEIQKLLDAGTSISEITRNLNSNGVKVSRSTVSKYINEEKRRLALGKEAKKIINDKKVPTCVQPLPTLPPLKAITEDLGQVKKHPVVQDQKNDGNNLPEYVNRQKYITVNGETLDVTKINIDDYIQTAKKYPRGEKIPPELKSIVRQENLVRNHYEEALKNYGNAIQEWKKTQQLNNS